MSMFYIDKAAKKRLSEIKEFAERNPYSMDDLFDVFNGDAKSAYQIDGYWCDIPIGWRVAFTIIQQSPNIRSLSICGYKSRPHPEIIKRIMKEFGFERAFDKCEIYTEGEYDINVLETIT